MEQLTDIRERLVRVETLLTESLIGLKISVDRLNDNFVNLEERMRIVEVDQAVTKVRVGFWGGIAGIVSVVWHLVGALWK